MVRKRVSMKGMGADAFFSPPSEEKEEEPVTQDNRTPTNQLTGKTDLLLPTLPVSQQTDITADQGAIIPTRQENVMPISQIASEQAGQIADIPVRHYISETATQDTSIPIDQEAGNPGSQQDSISVKQLMKATYYIWPEQDIKLETIRLTRRRKGDKVDKSALIREAIEKLTE